MRKRIGVALVAAWAVIVIAVPVHARPIVEKVPPQRQLSAAEFDRTHPAYRLRLAPQDQTHVRKPRLSGTPSAEHVPSKQHWSTSQAYV